MGTRSLPLCAAFCFAVACSAQAPVIEWQNNLGGSFAEGAYSIVPTSDGGYVVAGYARSTDGDVTNNHGDVDYWVVKLDPGGNLQWQKCLGGNVLDEAYSIAPTGDGGYVVAGYTRSTNGDVTNNHGFYDSWVVKLDNSGNLQWQKCLGGSDGDGANSIAPTSDGGYVVAGYTYSTDGEVTNNHGLNDYWVVKLDPSGNLQWQKTLGGSAYEGASSIAPTSDGGYIVAGATWSTDGDVTNNHGYYDYWVVKLDPSGNLQWQKTVGGSAYDGATSISPTSDGGYIVAGRAESIDGDVTNNHGGSDSWVVKLDPGGNLQWQKCLGGSDYDHANSIVPTSDGGYVVVGSTASTNGDVTNNHGNYDYWVVKLDPGGNLQWQKCLGGSGLDEATSIAPASDGGYVVGGYTTSADGDVTNNHGSTDYWVVKLGPENVGVLEQHATPTFTCSPNPANAILRVSTMQVQGLVVLSLTDALGRKLLSASMSGTTHTLAVGALPRGLYVVTLSSPEGRSAQRVVLE